MGAFIIQSSKRCHIMLTISLKVHNLFSFGSMDDNNMHMKTMYQIKDAQSGFHKSITHAIS